MSPGVLTINGNFTPTGTVQFEVNSPYDGRHGLRPMVVSGAVERERRHTDAAGGATPPPRARW